MGCEIGRAVKTYEQCAETCTRAMHQCTFSGHHHHHQSVIPILQFATVSGSIYDIYIERSRYIRAVAGDGRQDIQPVRGESKHHES